MTMKRHNCCDNANERDVLIKIDEYKQFSDRIVCNFRLFTLAYCRAFISK